MATGEFEYSSYSEEFSTANVVYATSTVLIFLVFLFLIFLVMMNVMTGLAVTDAKVRTGVKNNVYELLKMKFIAITKYDSVYYERIKILITCIYFFKVKISIKITIKIKNSLNLESAH